MENLCIICLSRDRKLYQISTCISGLITMILPELEISKLCWECNANIKRLLQLRKKALDSKRILDQHLKETVKGSTLQSKTNLEKCHIFTFSLCDNDVFNTEETTKVTNDNINNAPLPGATEQKNNKEFEETSRQESVIVDISTKECEDKIDSIVNKSANGFMNNRKQKKVRSKKRDALLKSYACSECKETFESRGKYEYHRQKHRGRVKCPICNRDFSCRSALNAHGSVAHSTAPRDDRRYCQPCAKFFKTDCSYRKHMRTSARHVDPETLRHPCPACGKRFARPEVRDEHHKRVHMRRGRLQCARCCRQYCSVRALRCHVTRRHTPTVTRRDYMCEVCGVGFKTAQVLKGHQRTHAKKLNEVKNNNCSELD